jgi:hypothetical protein
MLVFSMGEMNLSIIRVSYRDDQVHVPHHFRKDDGRDVGQWDNVLLLAKFPTGEG